MVDTVGRGLDNVSKGLSIIGQFDELANNRVSTFFKAADERKRLQKELGPWHDYLHNTEKEYYRNPVLTSSSFKKHMDACEVDGAFQPVGECHAVAPWVRFLYALGITPGMNNIEHILPTEPIQGFDVTLKIDGEVICHVVNLLAVDVDHDWQEAASKKGIYNTSIGDISWKGPKESGDPVQAGKISYKPVNDTALKSRHKWFPDYCDFQPLPHRLFVQYKLALDPEFGISDPDLVWPSPNHTDISKRVLIYTEAMEKITKSETTRSSPPKTTMVSQRWQDGAERVRRRAAGGGGATKLLRKACRVSEKSRAPTDGGSDEDSDVERRDRSLKVLEKWLTGASKLELHYSDGDNPTKDTAERGAAAALKKALLEYTNKESDTWEYRLASCAELVTRVLKYGHLIAVPKDTVYLLPFDRTAPLWKQRIGSKEIPS